MESYFIIPKTPILSFGQQFKCSANFSLPSYQIYTLNQQIDFPISLILPPIFSKTNQLISNSHRVFRPLFSRKFLIFRFFLKLNQAGNIHNSDSFFHFAIIVKVLSVRFCFGKLTIKYWVKTQTSLLTTRLKQIFELFFVSLLKCAKD